MVLSHVEVTWQCNEGGEMVKLIAATESKSLPLIVMAIRHLVIGPPAFAATCSPTADRHPPVCASP